VATYKITISKRPDIWISIYKAFDVPIGAYNHGKTLINNIFEEIFDITKHSISVEEQKE
jgi:hypothetical protein